MHARFASVLTLVALLFLTGGALLESNAQSQTNDPLVDQQQYLFDTHRFDTAWTYTTGSSNVSIGIYSLLGFIQNHEDLAANRLVSPVEEVTEPDYDIASEMAGIIGATTDNNVGMAGIDHAARLQSYSVLSENAECSDNCPEEAPVTFERSDGTTAQYFLNGYQFADLIQDGRDNDLDIYLGSC